MREPTDQEIHATKALAAERFGAADVRQLVLVMPGDEELVFLVQRHNAKTYAEWFDGSRTHLMDAISAVWAEHVLWPTDEAELDKLLEDWPAAKAGVADALNGWAGGTDNMVVTERLKSSGLPAIGLSPAVSKDLLAKGGKLWTVRLDGIGEEGVTIGCVMRSPDPARFTAANVSRRDAEIAKRGRLSSVRDFVTEQVVWCREPIGNLIARYPAFVQDLWSAFQIIGGATARARSKRV